MSTIRRVVLAGAVGMLAALPAIAATETVRVTKAMDDKAIVTRRNGESYLIEKGVGCLSLWRYEGKAVLIVSPGLFLGVGSKLLIPELDQECRIWNSELLSGSVAPPPTLRRPAPAPTPTPPKTAASDSKGIITIQRALRLVGYDPGPADGSMGPQTAAALETYRSSKGHPPTEDGLRKTLAALALDVVMKNPNTQDAHQVSLELIRLVVSATTSGAGTSTPPQGLSRSSCEERPLDRLRVVRW